jgi:hypothetical protein
VLTIGNTDLITKIKIIKYEASYKASLYDAYEKSLLFSVLPIKIFKVLNSK